MEISAESTGKPSQNASDPRNPEALPEAVPEHLKDERERQTERKSRNRRPHRRIRDPGAHAAELCSPCGHVLTAVIIIDRFARVPHILKGHPFRLQHRRDKAVIHELFRSVRARSVADHPHPYDVEKKENCLLSCDQADIHPFKILRKLPFIKKYNVHCTDSSRDDKAACLREGYEMHGVERKVDPRYKKEPDHIGKDDSPVLKTYEQRTD